MADNCYYQAKIIGYKKNALELVDMLQRTGKYKESGLGRVYDCDMYDIDPEDAGDDDEVEVYISGDCAWSVKTAMRSSDVSPSLETEADRLNLIIEIYSSEPGVGFQEHVLINFGDVLIDDCVDYREYDFSDFAFREELAEYCKANFGEDSFNEETAIMPIGGFGDKFGRCDSFSKEDFKIMMEDPHAQDN